MLKPRSFWLQRTLLFPTHWDAKLAWWVEFLQLRIHSRQHFSHFPLVKQIFSNGPQTFQNKNRMKTNEINSLYEDEVERNFPSSLSVAAENTQTGCQSTQFHQMKRVRTKKLILNLLYTSARTKLLIQNCSVDPHIYLVQYKPPKPKTKTSKTWCSLMTVVWMRIVRMTDLHIHPQSKLSLIWDWNSKLVKLANKSHGFLFSVM